MRFLSKQVSWLHNTVRLDQRLFVMAATAVSISAVSADVGVASVTGCTV